LITEILHV